VTFEVLTKAIAISSNKDSVVRGNNFTVTITGESKETTSCTSRTQLSEVEEYPMIRDAVQPAWCG
jgi:hypothetical protein